jgi:WD40 repeat protein
MSFASSTVMAVTATILVAWALPAQDQKPAGAVSFDRDIKPVFRKRCGACHNTERPRGELDLMTYSGVVAGSASGKVAVAGKPEDSPIYTLPAHLEEPAMPPNAPKIPERELELVRRWVEGGLIETSGDSQSTEGAPSTDPTAATLVAAEIPPHGSAIAALAVSPVAPLAAVSGHRQVFVFDLQGRKLKGALHFPEGDVFCLKFSKDGKALLAAGGEGAQSGKVVLFQTENWARGSTLGDEVDAVLAADLSPDQSRVALGGPNRAVKVIANPKGEVLHTFRKPTDWVTATAFSPDGLLVAAGDRFGGLFLWETRSGQEFLTLRGHPKTITAIGWNLTGDNLLTAGEDGAIQSIDLNDGKVIRRWEAHLGGVLSLAVHPSDRIASCGRDRHIKIWETTGKLVTSLGPALDQTTRVAWTADGRTVVSGDLSGDVRIWALADSSSVPLPMPLAPKPAELALVTPVLTPARPFTPKPAAIRSKVNQSESFASPGDDLEAALASATEAAASAERAVDTLSKLAGPRAAGSGRPPSPAEALKSAKVALIALETALAKDPGNTSLEKALAETRHAVSVLERKLGSRGSADEPSRTSGRSQ